MKRLFVIALLCLAHVASAGPRAILVLRSEGTADTASRTSIDSHVLRLAKSLDGKIDAGDITLTEAAAAVGCNASEAACKDDVLTTFGADELVTTTVTATPTGINVTVRRLTRNGASRAAQTTIASGKSPDTKLDTDIGPLFGLVTAAPAAVEARPVEAKATEPKPIEAKPATEGKPAEPPPPPITPVAGAVTSTAPIPNEVTAAPNGAVTQPPSEGAPNRRWQKVGMGVGGAMVLLAVLMWAQVPDVQDQIDAKPEPVSPADFAALKALEKRGDDLAGGGNLFFLVGAALGGVSTYYYVKAGKPRTQQARIAPAAFPHGAGVTLTFGGAP